jgi:hypothetical protein
MEVLEEKEIKSSIWHNRGWKNTECEKSLEKNTGDTYGKPSMGYLHQSLVQK